MAKDDGSTPSSIGEAEIVVRAFDSEAGQFRRRHHTVKVTNFTTVLDSLISIKEKEDPSLSVRYSCRMGICGSCAMVVNGKPRLACEAMVSKVGRAGPITVEPMRGHPILRGLVTDFDEFFDKHRSVKPWVMRNNPQERFNTAKEFKQTDEERDTFLPFAECIKCGLCVDACPVSNTNKEFLGPQALAQGYRYYADSKDQGKGRRLELLDTMDATWGCEFAGACSEVCPKGVDPALAIQMLKVETAKHRLLGGSKEK